MGFYLREPTPGTPTAEDPPDRPPARASRRGRPGGLASRNPHRGPTSNRILSSKYRDWESYLYYYGFRYYTCSRGRFLNLDPLALRAYGDNAYTFAGNSGINRGDALGLLSLDLRPSPIKSCSYEMQDIYGCGAAPCGEKKMVYVDGKGREQYFGYTGVVCSCSCPTGDDPETPWSVRCNVYVWCEILLDAPFRTERRMNCGPSATYRTRIEIYGHEQKHIQAVHDEVNRTIAPNLLSYEAARFYTRPGCDEHARRAQRWAATELYRLLWIRGQHREDRDPLPGAPGRDEAPTPIGGVMPPRAVNE
jgi:RHS repeat-associated protein